ncbi:hypothetical protein F5Y18DRAFT_436281 [Xylariaceae sp. FL1019]|nr:hypothetical protein F5Y18DRAFT_436281 [Xylariaceae sp. FL1019]
MIGTSFPEYCFIRCCIFVLQYTTPICLTYLLVSLACNGASALSYTTNKLLIGYSVLDALYAAFIFYPYSYRLKQAAKHPPTIPYSERKAIFNRCQDNIPDFTLYLRKWFLGATIDDIGRENVRDFISWAFFDRWPEQQTSAENEETDKYIDEIEQRIEHSLKPGRGNANSLRLTFEDVGVRYRSVVWYFMVGAVDIFTHLQQLRRGFQYYAQPYTQALSVVPPRPQAWFSKKRSVSRLSYWYRPHTSKDKLPIVFMHGIGIGLWPYSSYLASLNKGSGDDDQIGIIALEILPVSFRLTDAPLSQAEFLCEIEAILAEHQWDQFGIVGHSYGTVLATHMVRKTSSSSVFQINVLEEHLLKSATLSSRIDTVVLIDPVCILLHLPDVAYNFTRRKPTEANEWLLWYFASMDPGTAHCLGRHFFWKENIAWKEDLLVKMGKPLAQGNAGNGSYPARFRSRNVAVCLSERDLIVDTPTVLQYLMGGKDWASPGEEAKRTFSQNGSVSPQEQQYRLGLNHFKNDGIEVLWFPGLDHAQTFDYQNAQDRLTELTRRLASNGEK